LGLMTWTLPGKAAPPPAEPAATEADLADQGIQVEARGPIHEAFARPAVTKPQPGPSVPKQPPPPVAEEPPAQKPQGNNAQWIPGYWAWDVDKQDFVWVSGFWRIPPPGRKWVAGQWAKGADGWQWSPGFWQSATQTDIDPLDQPPPESLDNGPNVPAPDDTSNYVPGSWVPGDSGYLWRPGYWLEGQDNWVWNNASYAWTPGGYVYSNGYWDYPLAGRGVLFAPVSFSRPIFARPGFVFRPRFTVALDGLLDSLFVRPGFGHYYFGDYFAPRYFGMGFQPWYLYGPRFYDPLFSHFRWMHRGDWDRWYGGLRTA
jgi:hypothetical protein